MKKNPQFQVNIARKSKDLCEVIGHSFFESIRIGLNKIDSENLLDQASDYECETEMKKFVKQFEKKGADRFVITTKIGDTLTEFNQFGTAVNEALYKIVTAIEDSHADVIKITEDKWKSPTR